VIEPLPEPIPEPGADLPVSPPSDVDWESTTILEPPPELPVAVFTPSCEVDDEVPPY
jgi:hypothetical protein